MDIYATLHIPLDKPWKKNQKCPCGGGYIEHLEKKITFLREKKKMCPGPQKKIIGEYILDLKILLKKEKKKHEKSSKK